MNILQKHITDIWKIYHIIIIFTLHAPNHYIYAINILHLIY